MAITLFGTILQRSAAFQSSAPVGTGLEWLTIGAVLVPALLLVLLVYLGAQKTL